MIALGRAIDGAFAWGRRWETWGAVLVTVLRAAREDADAGAEAWALHQLGTRAFCLGDVAGARAALEEALRLRERLHDPAAAATRHNLGFIRDVDGRPGPRPKALTALAALAAVIAAVSIAAVVRRSESPPSVPAPTAPPLAVTPEPTPSATPDPVRSIPAPQLRGAPGGEPQPVG